MAPAKDILTFRALSALLGYPTATLVRALDDIDAILLDEALLDRETLAAVRALLRTLATGDLYELQADYVDTFDRSRRLSLHLFEHVHGEGRDRGQAMVDLAATYERAGLTPSTNELPDFLPLFLEFLSTQPRDEARPLLGQTAPILAQIGERLEARRSPYAAVMRALIAISGEEIAPVAETEPADADLDAIWAEAPVTFGVEDALSNAFDGCSADRLRTQLRAAAHDVRRTA